MKKCTMYQTADGAVHGSFEKAVDHASKRYGDALTKLAHKLVRVEKYHEMQDYIDNNLDAFQELAKLKVDTQVEEGDEEEDEYSR